MKHPERMILFPGYTAHNGFLPLETFRELAGTAAEAGFTHVDVGSAMTGRSRFQLDNGGVYREGYDFYPEYTAAFPGFLKFHAPAALVDAMPPGYAEAVERNRDELRKRAAILREFGLKASLVGASPQFLPECVYQAHPGWRGPRCDMPFRSRRPYFAPCVDHPEVLALYREASERIGAAAPNLDTAIFMCGDSGTGLCWQELYPGANGPQACAGRTLAARAAGFADALAHGLKGGGQPLIFLSHIPIWTFSGKLLPVPGIAADRTVCFARAPQDKPVTHENPLALLAALEAAFDARPDAVVFNIEQPAVTFRRGGLYPALARRFLQRPTRGPTERIACLKALTDELGLQAAGNRLLDAWQHLYRAIDDTSLGRLFYNSVFLYSAMSARLLTRPLLPLPDAADPGETLYYRRHVFDSLDDAAIRRDLLNVHGLRNPFLGRNACEMDRTVMCLESVCRSFDAALACLRDDPAGDAEGKAAAACADLRRRIGALRGFARTLQNACAFQALLDRARTGGYSPEVNAEALERVMRREIDNVSELIGLLEAGGAPLLPLADRAEDENTFLFGPDLADQLRRKTELMLAHWHDSQILFNNKTRYNT